MPSCLDHSALICETVESLRTAEHASLEWIYVLGEAQKAEKKEILHLRSKVLYKKNTQSTRDATEKKEAQIHNAIRYDLLTNYISRNFEWLGISL